ncbi:MAG: amidophosphoribosyltransferase [bacterium]
MGELCWKEECGIFGIYNNREAANLTYLGLYALQHRGQESAGIATFDGKCIHSHRQMGLVADIFKQHILDNLKGHTAIGHVRYSTAGSSNEKNCQPFLMEYSLGGLAIAHNGNLINDMAIRKRLVDSGSLFQSNSDTEVIMHLMARSPLPTAEERLIDALRQIKGAYCLVILTENKLIATRDPYGFRPLVLGRLANSYVVASETCAFDLIEAEFIREIEPGEVLIIDENGIKSLFPFDAKPKKQCIFEFIYFARPDSHIFGENVYMVRKKLGELLCMENVPDADMVVPVPDSGIPAAIGYANTAKLPLELGLIRNHYVGRTFIEPKQSIRHFGVKIKLNVSPDILKNKKVVVIDDSIVRGTTSRKIIKMVRNGGAKEVHFRISSPPIISPCYYGIDTPTHKELIANSHTIEEINRYITSDTLSYLSIDALRSSVKNPDDFCYACFTAKYPIDFPQEELEQLKLFRRK